MRYLFSSQVTLGKIKGFKWVGLILIGVTPSLVFQFQISENMGICTAEH